MAVSTYGKEIVKPKITSMMEEKPPVWIAGKGTPNGDVEPWKSAQKGSLYSQTDAADDAGCLWIKFDEGGDDDDWDLIPISTHTHT